MDDSPTIGEQLAIFALVEALRARAEAAAMRAVLEGTGVPEEALERAYLYLARRVAEESRQSMKEVGIPAQVADAVADRLITSLPEETAPESSRTGGLH